MNSADNKIPMRMSDRNENDKDKLQGGSRIHRLLCDIGKIMQRPQQNPPRPHEEEDSDREAEENEIFYPCGCKIIHHMVSNLGGAPGLKRDALHVIDSNIKFCEIHEKKLLKYIGKIRTNPTNG